MSDKQTRHVASATALETHNTKAVHRLGVSQAGGLFHRRGPRTSLRRAAGLWECVTVVRVVAKILTDVVVFRVRRLEMANLAGAVAIMLVLHLPWGDVLYRTAFGLVLNVLAYLNNDYLDVIADLKARDRNPDMTSFLHRHLGAARGVQWGLVGALVAIGAFHSWGLLAAGVAGGGVCLLYSAYWKHVPYLDVLAMTLWGAAMPMVGFPLDSMLGWALALQLGLFSSVFEPLQVVRDRRKDEGAAIRTTAVVLGTRRTLAWARANMLLCAVYGAAVLHPAVGVICLVALAVPVGEEHASRDWQRVKLVYGVAWLVCCGLVYVSGETAGLLVRLP